jgi:sulfoxide reductase heme-binding subunit YedZ
VSARALGAALLAAPQRHYRWTWRIALALCCAPVALLGGEFAAGRLGVNPFERLSHFTGTWALDLLVATLAITPARRHAVNLARAIGAPYGRRPSDWNWLVRLRRTLGLAAFFYGALHAAVYFTLDLGFDLAAFAGELSAKPFIAAGVAAFLLLVPLAATSTDAMMRRLGRNWRRLHRLVYATGILAVLHYVWLAKPGISTPYVYAALLALLLLDRLVAALRRRGSAQPVDEGMEVAERQPGAPVVWPMRFSTADASHPTRLN